MRFSGACAGLSLPGQCTEHRRARYSRRARRCSRSIQGTPCLGLGARPATQMSAPLAQDSRMTLANLAAGGVRPRRPGRSDRGGNGQSC